MECFLVYVNSLLIPAGRSGEDDTAGSKLDAATTEAAAAKQQGSQKRRLTYNSRASLARKSARVATAKGTLNSIEAGPSAERAKRKSKVHKKRPAGTPGTADVSPEATPVGSPGAAGMPPGAAPEGEPGAAGKPPSAAPEGAPPGSVNMPALSGGNIVAGTSAAADTAAASGTTAMNRTATASRATQEKDDLQVRFLRDPDSSQFPLTTNWRMCCSSYAVEISFGCIYPHNSVE